ncbi:outer membrane protein assembly factor BamB [Alteromonas sp. a30]|uniref:outer membrane protein assembly factor BamB n=1 Tax=Alteromonas sp. a30 TaxID=2730917 RepID=UPI002282EB11|nr:outer membrane protein assembly factor BamB [Alteromonas sp. a30]MCY7294585.1 outer membrane protein assembly factor BamB [Alteromonas sp. a30]
MVKGKHFLAALVPVLFLSGCSSIPEWVNPTTWFDDEEEQDVQQLKPIDELFQPDIKWDSGVGDGVKHYFSRLSPANAYGKVFAANRQGLVKAVDENTGDKVWEIDLAEYHNEGYLSAVTNLWADGISAKISGGLVASYETLYFGTENGLVLALDEATGEIKWQQKVKGEVLATPVVDGGFVVVNTGSGILYGLDAETGEEKWIYESEVPPLTLRGISAPALSAGAAIVGTANGKLSAVVLESGQVAWEQVIASASGTTELERLVDIDSQALVLGGVVYTISYNGTLAAVELRTGRVIWKREYRSYRRISLDGNTLFVVDDSSQVYGLDRRTGVELWAQTTLRGRDLTAATPMDSYVVVGDKFGFLHWLRQSDGQLVARIEVGGDDEEEGIYVAPVRNGKVLYTQTRDGDLVAISIP